MAELADAQASGACGINIVRVQVPFPACPGIIADAVILFCIKGKFSFQRTLEIKNARWKRA